MNSAEELRALYACDPLTQEMQALLSMAIRWPDDIRTEVLETLGDIAIVTGTRGAREHVAAAEVLSVLRRIVRLAGQQADELHQPFTREG